jgi:hypothetical protein
MGAILQLHELDGSLADGWIRNGLTADSSADGTRAVGTGVLIQPHGRVVRFRGEPAGFLRNRIVVNRGRSVLIGTPNAGFTVLPRLTHASATAPSGALVVAVSKEGRRDVVYDVRRAQPILMSPPGRQHFEMSALSPDGSYVVATRGTFDWPWSPTRLVIAHTASGKPVASLAWRGSDELQTYWEDADHLLVAARDRTGAYIFRLGVDGVSGRATEASTTRYGYVLPS